MHRIDTVKKERKKEMDTGIGGDRYLSGLEAEGGGMGDMW